MHSSMGAFNNYVDRILPMFDTPLPLPPAWTVFIP